MSDSTWVNAELAELRHHYGSAYIIACARPGRWIVERRDNGETLTANSAGAPSWRPGGPSFSGPSALVQTRESQCDV